LAEDSNLGELEESHQNSKALKVFDVGNENGSMASLQADDSEFRKKYEQYI